MFCKENTTFFFFFNIFFFSFMGRMGTGKKKEKKEGSAWSKIHLTFCAALEISP